MNDFDSESPLEALGSVAAIFAFITKTCGGLDGARELLRMMDRDPCYNYRGCLLESADILRRLGLVDLSQLLREHARTIKKSDRGRGSRS